MLPVLRPVKEVWASPAARGALPGGPLSSQAETQAAQPSLDPGGGTCGREAGTSLPVMLFSAHLKSHN